MRAISILDRVAPVWTAHPSTGAFDLSGAAEIRDAIVSIITRHPMRQSELERALARWAPTEVKSTVQQLVMDGRVRVVRRNGVDYWTVAEAHFPTDHRTSAG